MTFHRAALLFLIIFTLSLKWPVDKGRITSTFGESRADHFHDGIDMVCPDDLIYPIADGSLVFGWHKGIFPLDKYPGGGNYKVLRHSNGLLSVYMHLADGLSLSGTYSEKKPMAKIGNTGHSYGKHLHFSILNPLDRSSVNPYKVLPPFEDKTEPVIGEMLVRIKDSYTTLKDNSRVRFTKHHPLLIKVFDRIIGKENLGIYSLEVEHNGRKIHSSLYDRLLYSPQGLTVSSLTFLSLFDEKGYYSIGGIKYSDGLNRFKVRACDYSGNCAEKIFNLEINLDISEGI